MNYNDLSHKAHENAKIHGFWNQKLSNEHYLMLIIAEISEMVKADRSSHYADLTSFENQVNPPSALQSLFNKTGFAEAFESNIKNTIQDETADVAIYLADLAGHLGINFDMMQPCRYYRAFDKFTFTENAFALAKGLSKENIPIPRRILFGLTYVENWAKAMGIDIDKFIALKMTYNMKRTVLHGKKY